mmetsp:Transcript_17135/g.32124  ORF Transcript_17135/g.32124 Transcript_17135/m.32124 type:complete len:450 (+) Transcript_17135:164-1513(+)|eukprot:CAMPEP_0201674564 /NCGR_PEP_ID=MMETSP0494-20130426/37402_1 /ASSEMBLY_ACC=CAM_ASM_000839 /TAXON_ID=420259 /ORGANISM="Thalassiosira gravida, Strain GMp14c1" /LENGTH=449 /DNA_ID=CAMNT_0048156741 /DNA_START=92 /DNA_END=1441 /DNA_ORIENTATION=+
MVATPPTTTQQHALAYAGIPFASLSFLSSCYVIHHLLYQQPHKLKRLYHRLVLAMNFAALPFAIANIWGTWAVPEDTPYFAGAVGNVNTCTSQGFIKMMFSLTVATYYASLILSAFMGIRNNFKEEEYAWIELPIHVIAYCIPCGIASTIAATDNFNPSATGCWYAKTPRGCDSDPNVDCVRGQDIKLVGYILWFTTIFVYFIFPALVVLFMYCWMKKNICCDLEKTSIVMANPNGSGMAIIQEEAKKDMMHSFSLQIALYLFSSLSTWVVILISNLYQLLTGTLLYNLAILGWCIFALQGFVFMVVYFTLQRMGRQPKGDSNSRMFRQKHAASQASQVNVQSSHGDDVSLSRVFETGLSVDDIRSTNTGYTQRETEHPTEHTSNNLRESFNFNVFDGASDQENPLVRFFDQGDSEDDSAPNVGDRPRRNEEFELTDRRNGQERIYITI